MGPARELLRRIRQHGVQAPVLIQVQLLAQAWRLVMTAHRRLVLIATSALAVGLASANMPRLAAQTPANVQTAVDAAYAKFKDLKEGKNADYIPALAKVDPNLFGIAVVTADGKVYTAGDVKTEVSIQSISKVPGKFGIAVVSPPLDDAGNSVRAQRAI